MPFKLTVDQPSLGEQEIYIHGLGSFGNGTHDITDEQADDFRVINSQSGYGEPDEEGNVSIVNMPGPDLETAVASMYGVTIEIAPPKPPKPPKPTADTTTTPQGAEGTGGE